VQGANTLNDAWAGPCVQEQDGAARNLNNPVPGSMQLEIAHQSDTNHSRYLFPYPRLTGPVSVRPGRC
jgi:hypothetical protein